MGDKVVRLELDPEDALLLADALLVFAFDVGDKLNEFDDYDHDDIKRMLERADRAEEMQVTILEAYSETTLRE